MGRGVPRAVSLNDWGSDELLVDNSIYARRDHPVVVERWAQAAGNEQLILVQPMLMEVLYSAKNGEAAGEESSDLQDAFGLEVFDAEVWDLAIATQIQLARVGNGYQRRFSIPDLLTAALAHSRGYGVLHYDGDYDEIRDNSDLDYASVWAAEPPALDPPTSDTRDDDAIALRKSLRLLLGTLDDIQDADLLGRLFESLRGQVEAAGLRPAPRLPQGK